MAKAKTAVVIVILALLQVVSCATAPRLPGRHPSCCDDTAAVMTVMKGFGKGQDGGGASACGGKFHSNDDMIVALSSQWYGGGKRCHNSIRITSTDTGRTVEAQVVDECDSSGGCKNNIVDSSPAVWKKLVLDTEVGEVHVTWSDA